MRLRYVQGSPYTRKVLVAAHEVGVFERLELVPAHLYGRSENISADNPLRRVPTLIRDDGEPLFDSVLICEYLDALEPPMTLHPAPGPARWQALRLQALGDGIMDGAVPYRQELRREPAKQSAYWIARYRDQVIRSLDMLESLSGELDGALTIGHVALACGLGYLDWRDVAGDWRSGRPGIAAWFDGFAGRPSMRASEAILKT